jgi:hypothetical protein
VVSWDGDEITAGSTQGISAREELADAFGLRKDDVRVRTKFIGGFGAKQEAGSRRSPRPTLRLTGRPSPRQRPARGQLDGGRRGPRRTVGGASHDALHRVEVDAVVAMNDGRMFPVVSPARTLYRCADVPLHVPEDESAPKSGPR